MNDNKAINTAEKLVDKLKFWREPNVVEMRKLRVKIRTNYKTARSLFYGFFDKVRDSVVSDFVDNDTMMIAKVIHNPDKTVMANAISALRVYGFQLDVCRINKDTYKVVMHPDEVIANYKNELYLSPETVDHHTVSDKMKIKFG